MVKHILALGAMGLGVGLGVVSAPYLSGDVSLFEHEADKIESVEHISDSYTKQEQPTQFTAFDFHHSYIEEFNQGDIANNKSTLDDNCTNKKLPNNLCLVNLR